MQQEDNSAKVVNVNGVIFSRQDIFRVVDDFYTRIQQDPILQVPFRSVVDWPEHIHRLTDFWWVRFGGKPSVFNSYNPVAKHFFAGFNQDLLTRWLAIFHQTLQDQLTPEQANLWKLLSERMGETLFIKNELFKNHYEQSK